MGSGPSGRKVEGLEWDDRMLKDPCLGLFSGHVHDP